MSGSKFVYVTYIRTSSEKLFDALIKPEFTKLYWVATWQESDWTPGAEWKMFIPDGRVADAGEVIEIERPTKLVLKWRNEFQPDLKAEGYSRCEFTLEEIGDMVKLTVTHEMDIDHSKLIEGVSGGWPMILASLKAFQAVGQ